MVVAGSPLRLFRLSPGGAHVVALVEAGDPPSTPSVRQFLDRFVDAGALHPVPDPGEAPFTDADITVVVPAHAALPRLTDLRTIVVDDCSPTPLAPSEPNPPDHVMPSPHVLWLRHDMNRGPGAARNTGLAHVTTPLVAFVDTDVELPPGWTAPLLAHFADPRVAIVAPRVASRPGPGAVADFETRHSPLDLGDEPARVSPGTRVSYLPAAVLVCRTDVVRELGGFDEGLRFGEDVDLVWRAVEAGHRARYEPTVVALHDPRTTWGALWRQRAGYGRSAAPLARRHPGALAPVRMSGWSAAVWALLALRRPILASGVAAATTVALAHKLHDLAPEESARLALLGHLAAGRQLASAVRRVWWPLALVAAVCSRRTRPALAAAVLAVPLVDAWRTRSARAVLDAPAQLADDLAYGAGLWAGVVADRAAGPLVPSFSGWPSRGGG